MPDQDVAALANETDADLLVYMSMAADDAAVARAAWGVFYHRHVRYLWAVCQRSYADLLGGSHGAADLVAETFRRAYERAERFDADGVTDPEAQRRLVRAWLGRIAQRLAQDVVRGRRRLRGAQLELEHWQQITGPVEEADERADAIEIQLVREALEALPEREQIVLRVTMQWYQPEATHQRLPDDVCRDVAQTLGTTPENLRQIRRRALAKVREHVTEGLKRTEQKEKRR